ncbi:MAG: flavodoxin domain-containing protein [Mangrovicoccus sp.]|nr:flavodoxin domain-containing protein [Mangrovicoccus sp.]
MKISLLYGTETGNAELLCEELQEALSDGHEVDVANLEDVSPDALSAEAFYVFVCSTYGEGELPSSAIDFFTALTEEKPDLSGIRFAVFGLGDTTYDETFNNGSTILADSLVAANAQQIGPRGVHDASGDEDAESIALPWLQERLAEAS